MARPGTTAATADKFKAKAAASRPATAGNKNIAHGARKEPKPTGPTGPIKGSDRGGV